MDVSGRAYSMQRAFSLPSGISGRGCIGRKAPARSRTPELHPKKSRPVADPRRACSRSDAGTGARCDAASADPRGIFLASASGIRARPLPLLVTGTGARCAAAHEREAAQLRSRSRYTEYTPYTEYTSYTEYTLYTEYTGKPPEPACSSE